MEKREEIEADVRNHSTGFMEAREDLGEKEKNIKKNISGSMTIAKICGLIFSSPVNYSKNI